MNERRCFLYGIFFELRSAGKGFFSSSPDKPWGDRSCRFIVRCLVCSKRSPYPSASAFQIFSSDRVIGFTLPFSISLNPRHRPYSLSRTRSVFKNLRCLLGFLSSIPVFARCLAVKNGVKTTFHDGKRCVKNDFYTVSLTGLLSRIFFTIFTLRSTP